MKRIYHGTWFYFSSYDDWLSIYCGFGFAMQEVIIDWDCKDKKYLPTCIVVGSEVLQGVWVRYDEMPRINWLISVNRAEHYGDVIDFSICSWVHYGFVSCSISGTLLVLLPRKKLIKNNSPMKASTPASLPCSCVIYNSYYYRHCPLLSLTRVWRGETKKGGKGALFLRRQWYNYICLLNLTVKLTKPWTPEIIMECYCVARNKPIRHEITKPQTATVINLWFWGLLAYPELYCDWPAHNPHSWNFSGVHCFVSLTVTRFVLADTPQKVDDDHRAKYLAYSCILSVQEPMSVRLLISSVLLRNLAISSLDKR